MRIMKKSTASIFALATFIALTGVAHAGGVTTRAVPDAGATSVLMGVALVGLAFAKRFIR
jgi:hypothetical protein